MIDYYSSEQKHMPRLGLLALAFSLVAYVFGISGRFESSATLIGVILLVAGSIQILIGIRSQQQGHPYAAATLLPFGMFWLSMIGYEIFPKIGIGLPPNGIAMFSYLSLWALFVAMLFSPQLQATFGDAEPLRDADVLPAVFIIGSNEG